MNIYQEALQRKKEEEKKRLREKLEWSQWEFKTSMIGFILSFPQTFYWLFHDIFTTIICGFLAILCFISGIYNYRRIKELKKSLEKTIKGG